MAKAIQLKEDSSGFTGNVKNLIKSKASKETRERKEQTEAGKIQGNGQGWVDETVEVGGEGEGCYYENRNWASRAVQEMCRDAS